MRPRRVGTFLMSRRPTSAKLSARSRIASISSRSTSSIASRCFMPAPPRSWLGDRHLVDPVDLLEADVDPLLARGRQVLADVVGADRQLAVAAVAEDGELDPLRAAVVEEGLDRGADGAAGEEDVVDEDDGALGEVEVDVGGVDDRLRGGRLGADVVAVEGDVDVADRQLGAGQLAEEGVQATGEERRRGCGCRRRRDPRARGSSRRSRGRSAAAFASDRRARARPSHSLFASFLASRDLVKGRPHRSRGGGGSE